ncbi:MAG: hypothetical protein RSG59_09595, partial [Ruthenibacterium sp.]
VQARRASKRTRFVQEQFSQGVFENSLCLDFFTKFVLRKAEKCRHTLCLSSFSNAVQDEFWVKRRMHGVFKHALEHGCLLPLAKLRINPLRGGQFYVPAIAKAPVQCEIIFL